MFDDAQMCLGGWVRERVQLGAQLQGADRVAWAGAGVCVRVGAWARGRGETPSHENEMSLKAAW